MKTKKSAARAAMKPNEKTPTPGTGIVQPVQQMQAAPKPIEKTTATATGIFQPAREVQAAPKPIEKTPATGTGIFQPAREAQAAPKPIEKTPPTGTGFFQPAREVQAAPKPIEKTPATGRGFFQPAREAQAAPKPIEKTPTRGAVTVIDVKKDVGFGNAIYLRGKGSGLTWERGVPLVCVDGSTWRWSQTVTDTITFKVLLNDQVWSAGQDLTVAPGQKVEVAPSFA
jgi:hypothetical protein